MIKLKKIARKIRNGIIKTRFKNKPLESAFTYIYANNQWGHEETVSGHGSSLGKTVTIRSELPKIISQYHIGSIFDAPCGDYNWMKLVDLTGIKYTGGDIVKALIKSNKRKYGSEDKAFKFINVVTTTAPKVDLILCRDLLIHLPLDDCLKAILGFLDSESKYILITTYNNNEANEDISPGAWRPVNLQIAPFNFPEPIQLIDDGDSDPTQQDYGKCLGLWRISDIENYLSSYRIEG